MPIVQVYLVFIVLHDCPINVNMTPVIDNAQIYFADEL